MSHAVIMVAVPGVGDLEELVGHEMAPFSEDDESFKNGSRWDWWVIGGRWENFFQADGAVITLGTFDVARWQRDKRVMLEGYWEEAQKEADPVRRSLFYGVEPEQTREQYTEPGEFPTPRAFLGSRRWNESARLGWWGMDMATECELDGNKKKARRCSYNAESKGAKGKVVTWNDDRKTWDTNFYKRFLTPLDPTTRLVAVDYHV